jgi:transposase-like protein
MMGLRCKRCGGEERVKNGLTRGKQRYRCKACGLNFTGTPPRGMPLRVKVTAVLLYLSGLSMNRTAKLLGVSTPSVMTWIEQFAKAYAQKPEPEGRAVVVELDEMWHFLKKSGTSSGCGRLGIVLPDGSSTGSWGVVTRPLSTECLSAWSAGASVSTARTTGRPEPVLRRPTADRGAELIPQGRLYVGKDQTHGIERDHSRQRHWLARFRRRTCVVSKAERMVDASIALFVRFGDADGIGELLSMLA